MRTTEEYFKDLETKAQFLLDSMDLEDKCFTFPDGETWHQTPPKPDPNANYEPLEDYIKRKYKPEMNDANELPCAHPAQRKACDDVKDKRIAELENLQKFHLDRIDRDRCRVVEVKELKAEVVRLKGGGNLWEAIDAGLEREKVLKTELAESEAFAQRTLKRYQDEAAEVEKLQKQIKLNVDYAVSCATAETEVERLRAMVGTLAKRLKMWVDGSGYIDSETKALLEDAALDAKEASDG